MNRTALITGSSNGIGYELAQIHASKGGDLVLIARNGNKLQEMKSDLEKKHIKVHVISKDLSLPDSAKEVYDELMQNNISIEYLINNAGFGNFGLFAESDWNRQQQMINLNVLTLVHLTWLFLPEMIRRESGKIMNVASVASFSPGPTMAVYFATKAFVLSFSEAINNEVSSHGITVTALCPGSTVSGFREAASLTGNSLYNESTPTAHDVALFGYRAMMKGRAVAIHGLKNRIMANSVRFAPRSLVTKFARRVQEKKH